MWIVNACTLLILPLTHKAHAETECSKAMAEFARIEDQLSGIERYAMKYLEEANAEFAAAQLRLAEVRIKVTNLSLVSLVFEVMAHNIVYIHIHHINPLHFFFLIGEHWAGKEGLGAKPPPVTKGRRGASCWGRRWGCSAHLRPAWDCQQGDTSVETLH